MKLFAIVAACVMLAPPTFEACFDQYLLELRGINENEAWQVISHWEAVNQRMGAMDAYLACREQAWQAWAMERMRESLQLLWD